MYSFRFNFFWVVHIHKFENSRSMIFTVYLTCHFPGCMCYVTMLHYHFDLIGSWNILVFRCIVYMHRNFFGFSPFMYLGECWSRFIDWWCEFQYLRNVHVCTLSQCLICIYCVFRSWFFSDLVFRTCYFLLFQ